MKYSNLPQTKLKVSKICLGTMTFGQQNTEAQGHQQMSYALERGVNFFDTAEIYASPIDPKVTGATEKIIGNWLKATGYRHKIILASKIVGSGEASAHVRTNGYKPESIREAIEGSLKRLQTDYLDLYQLHWPIRQTNCFGQRGYMEHQDDWEDDFNEILHTLNDCIKVGKIRYIGLSNETAWGVMRFLEESKYNNLPKIKTIQNPYSLLNRLYEEALSEISLREDLGLLAYSPLGFGVLSGKYMHGNTPSKGRLSLYPRMRRYSSENSFKATEMYAKIAKKHEVSLAQMALAFVNTRPFLTSNIIGATTMVQLEENIDSINFKFTNDMLKDVEEVHQLIPNPSC